MGAVVEFKRKEPHGSGEAFCIGCGHEWVAVAPVGVTHLQCPECKTMKGHFKFEYYPEVGSFVRECNCGNQLFYLTKDGHLCPNCGTYQTY